MILVTRFCKNVFRESYEIRELCCYGGGLSLWWFSRLDFPAIPSHLGFRSTLVSTRIQPLSHIKITLNGM